MFNEERMVLDRCVECGKGVAIGEKIVLIYEDSFGKYWAHNGECSTSYSKSLADPKDMKRGFIIGICGRCAKPVRRKDEFEVGRTRLGNMTHEDFLTTIPQKDAIDFMHTKCADEAFSS